MTRPTRTLATLFALLGSAAVMTGTASAQTYQSPPAHHVPMTTYGTTTYQPVYAAPAPAPSYTAGTVATQPHGGRIVYGTAPVPSPASTQTYIAPASQATVDTGVTYAPYYGTPQPQPQPVYRQPAPVPVYRAPAPVQTWVRPPQPVYAPEPVYAAPQFGAPAVFGGLFGAAILGSILLDDDDHDRDRHRHRGRDHRGDRHDGVRRGGRFERDGDRARRQDLTREERRALRQQERTREDRRDARQQNRIGQDLTREERRDARRQDRAGQERTREERRAARQQQRIAQERAEERARQDRRLTRDRQQARRRPIVEENRSSYPASWRSNN